MKYFIALFLCVLLLPAYALANVKINEVAWMGTASSQYSEWIELHNDGTDSVSLDGWKLYKTGNTVLFTLSKTISAGGYVLVERTTASAPDAVPGVAGESGTFGGGGLRNTGEDLTLVDKTGKIIDNLPFAGGWPAGDAKTKDTMQLNGSSWITAPGTPDAQNASPTPVENTTTDDTGTAEQTPVSVTETPAVQTPVIQTSESVPTTASTIETPQVQPEAGPVVDKKPEQIPQAESAPNTSLIISTVPTAIVNQPKPSKKTSVKKSAPVISSAQNDNEAALLEDPAEQTSEIDPGQKENNHAKIFIFGAVILIGMALFLLLQRFKAREE
ncbi:MAG TPA: lamin tail domain-containing protein [Candidatus Paceibacterota bacterium]|jgi:hypothetical protein|nr:lamin tail domain-containing protein [Candidatus Paceibacterota bacterium]